MTKRASTTTEENDTSESSPPVSLVSSSWFGRRYRIVRDSYAGYEVQVWRWYWPFWSELNFCNTHFTVEEAEEYARVQEGQVVKYL